MRGGFFDVDQLRQAIGEIEDQLSQPDVWKDRSKAEQLARRLSELKNDVETFEQLNRSVADAAHVLAEPDAQSIRADLEKQIDRLENSVRELEFRILLSEKYDEHAAILSVHAGTGGTDAQDWAAMLLRMLLRYCERRGWKTRLLDESRGQEAGIKSATVEVTGRFAYGQLKSESGVHRLVRISPFDAEKMRHTSFALVEVIPDLEDIEEITIDEKDLRIDTYLSSGHGGQSVQTTYSAVRIVHLPTNIMVTCQNERSQRQNKETALKILKGKLAAIEHQKQEAEKRRLRGEYQSAEWGNQIRSYVLQPYKLVKDHRTKVETGDVDAVLDGRLENFIEGYLRWSKERAEPNA